MFLWNYITFGATYSDIHVHRVFPCTLPCAVHYNLQVSQSTAAVISTTRHVHAADIHDIYHCLSPLSLHSELWVGCECWSLCQVWARFLYSNLYSYHFSWCCIISVWGRAGQYIDMMDFYKNDKRKVRQHCPCLTIIFLCPRIIKCNHQYFTLYIGLFTVRH